MRTVNLAEVLMPYGIEADLDDDDLVTEVIVIAKVSAVDGETSLQISAPDGCDWIAQFGLLAAAWHIARSAAPGERGG